MRSKQINYKFEINSIISDNEIITNKNDIASKINTEFNSIGFNRVKQLRRPTKQS